MVVEKNNKVEDYKFKKGNLNFAVVGHVEWTNFLKVDSYGCGDSFAAGILYEMASKWTVDKSLNLAKVMGRDASEFFGPYANIDGK